MQDNNKKEYFIQTVGNLIRKIRLNNRDDSLSNFANEYDIDKSGLSKIERGVHSAEFVNIWRILEALGLKFSEFALMLEKELGENFKFMDE